MAFRIKSIKTYNSNGTVDIDEYNEEGMLIHSIMALSPTESPEFFYSEKDNVRYKEDDDSSWGSMPPDECKYDEQGRLIERISYLPNCNEIGGETSSIYVKTLHEYLDHDDYGNWLSVINYDLDAKGERHIVDTNRREIEYY